MVESDSLRCLDTSLHPSCLEVSTNRAVILAASIGRRRKTSSINCYFLVQLLCLTGITLAVALIGRFR